MIVRPFKEGDDFDNDLEELIVSFCKESVEDSLGVDKDVISQTVQAHKENSFLLIDGDKCVGVLAGMVVQSPVGNDKVFQEVVWYVRKDKRNSGVRLLDESMRILKERGITKFVMVCLYSSRYEKLDRFYKRLGFKPLEKHYIRSL